MSIQDTDVEVIKTRCTTIADVLFDLDQISDYALVTCTAVLAQTVLEHPDKIGDVSTSAIVARALSSVLALGTGLSDNLRTAVEEGITALSIGAQSNLAIGEDPLELMTNSMKATTAVGNGASLEGTSYLLPQSEFELFANIPPPQMALSINQTLDVDGIPLYTAIPAGAAIGVTVLQFATEQGGQASGDVASIALQTQQYSSAGTSSRRTRRLLVDDDNAEIIEFIGLNGFRNIFPSYKGINWVDLLSGSYEQTSKTGTGRRPGSINPGVPVASAPGSISIASFLGKLPVKSLAANVPAGNGMSVDVVLYNKQPIIYDFLEAERNEIVCYKIQDEPYDVLGICTSGYKYTVSCPGKRSVFNNTCPGYTERPMCTLYDSVTDAFVPSPFCKVKHYDSLSTTCTCSSGITGRRLLEGRETFSDGYPVSTNSSESRRNLQAAYRRRLASSSSSNSFSAHLITINTPLILTYYETISYFAVKDALILNTVGLFVAFFAVGLIFFAWWDDIERRKVSAEKEAKKLAREDAQLNQLVKATPIEDDAKGSKDGTLNDTGRLKLTGRSTSSDGTSAGVEKKVIGTPVISPEPETPATAYSRRISTFFDSLLPDEFRPGRGHVLFTNRLFVEHTWMPLFAPFREDSDGRGVRWAIALLGRISSYIFFITVLAANQFADDNSCEDIIDYDLCMDEATPFVGKLKCGWDPYAKACFYVQPTIDTVTVISYGLVIFLFVAPVAKIQEIFIMEATKLPWFPYSPFLAVEKYMYKGWMLVYAPIYEKFFKKTAPKLLSEEDLDKLIAAKMSKKPLFVPPNNNGQIAIIDGAGEAEMDAQVERELNGLVDGPEDRAAGGDATLVPFSQRHVTPKKDAGSSELDDRPFGLETPNVNSIDTMELPPTHKKGSKKASSKGENEKIKLGAGGGHFTPLGSARSQSSNGSHASAFSATASKYATRPDLSINLGLDPISETTPDALVRMNKARLLNHDEFHTVQTTRGKMLRAARLAKAQTIMEFSTPYEEASLLAGRIYNDRKRAKNFIVSTMVSEVDIPRIKSRYEDRVDDELSRYGSISDDKIIAMVVNARSSAVKINKEIEQMLHEEDREMHLMRHFFIDNLSGYSRGVAPRYLFNRATAAESNVEISVAAKLAAYTRQLFYIGLMAGLTFVQFLYVMVSGGAILGSKATPLWVTMLTYCVLLDAFFMQFAVIFFRCVLLRATFVDEISSLAYILRTRSRVIMMRTFGNLRDATTYQQHLNPACRVARQHPHLPISRLLLSISDVDVPISSEDSKKLYTSLGLLPIYWRMNNFMTLTTTLPNSVQDTITEMSCILLSNLVAIALYLVAQVSFNGAVALAVLMICIFNRAYFYQAYNWCKDTKKRVTRHIKARLAYHEPGRQPEDEANEFSDSEDDIIELSPEKQLEKAMKKSLKMQAQADKLKVTQTGVDTFGHSGFGSPEHNKRLLQDKLFGGFGSPKSPELSPMRSLGNSPDATTPLGDSTYGQLGPPVDYRSPVRPGGGVAMKSGLAPPKGVPSRALHPQSVVNVGRFGAQAPGVLMSRTQPLQSNASALEIELEPHSVGKPLPPASRRAGLLPSLLDAPPISGSSSPYKIPHKNIGYGANTLFSPQTPEPFKKFRGKSKSPDNTREVKDFALGGGGLSGFGLSSIESIELVPGLNGGKAGKDLVLPEAAFLLFDTSGQEDIMAFKNEMDDPVLNIDVLNNTVVRREEAEDRRRRRGESRERDLSPDKRRGHSSHKKDRPRKYDRESPDKDKDRPATRDRDRDRGPGEMHLASSTHGNLGLVQKLSEEDKARRRIQARLNRRHKASEHDFEFNAKRDEQEEETEKNEYYSRLEEKDRERGNPVMKRDTQSVNDSTRDHYRSNRRTAKRYKDEQKEKQQEDYLETRAGPGDRSIYNLDKEKPVESALFRNGLMLLGKEDRATPKLNLAFDAHDYITDIPVNVRVANKAREARVMPLMLDQDRDDERIPIRTISRDGREKRAQLLGSARDLGAAGGGGGGGTSTHPRDGSPNKQPVMKASPQKGTVPTQGPGAARLPFPDVDNKEPPAVEVKPAQKYPMWTT